MALLAVFIAAIVTTLTLLGWGLAANWWRCPRFGGSSWTLYKIATLPLYPHERLSVASTEGRPSAVALGADSLDGAT